MTLFTSRAMPDETFEPSVHSVGSYRVAAALGLFKATSGVVVAG